MLRHLALISGLFFACWAGATQGQSSNLRELLLEARALAEDYGDRIWEGFSDAPFGVLLVEKDRERLFCHKGPAPGFEATGTDPILSCPSSIRQASFPKNMLATFPVVGGISTIVMGTPEATGLSSDAWVLTVVHEHFHQVQFSWPGYYSGTENLGLSGGDETGMWMLNYPFPYERGETALSFRVMADRLIDALSARGTGAFHDSVMRYWHARELARQTVSTNDWKYVELQFWQEGVARWTESAIAALSDEYSHAAAKGSQRTIQDLSNLDLAQQGRSAVYPIGAGEAMLLDALDPEWRMRYWTEPFSLGTQFEKLIDEMPNNAGAAGAELKPINRRRSTL